MIELGVKQKLYIDHKTDFGVYLSDTPERNGKSDFTSEKAGSTECEDW